MYLKPCRNATGVKTLQTIVTKHLSQQQHTEYIFMPPSLLIEVVASAFKPAVK